MFFEVFSFKSFLKYLFYITNTAFTDLSILVVRNIFKSIDIVGAGSFYELF